MAFRLANVEGRAALLSGDSFHDLESLTGGELGTDPMAALGSPGRLHELSAGLAPESASGPIVGALLDAPVPRPRNCFAIGLNYRTHVEEMGRSLPEVPVVFTKFPSCLTGPHHDISLVGSTVDYEAELVVVIGPGGKDIPAADAWNHVVGLTAGQDISDRDLQVAASPPHFDLGKSRDGYGPMGPAVVSVDSFADPDDISVRCWVDGELRQSASTGDMIFGVPELVEYLSGILTLATGDVIFTGTPSGVGLATGRTLAAGSVVETSIGGIATMRNRCVA